MTPSELAFRTAVAAAEQAGVEIRELEEIPDLERVFHLYYDIWHPDPLNAPVSVEMMRAFSHTGNYVTGAYDGDLLVGASVAFRAAPPAERLHSHVTGAVKKGAGFALKLHQRAWALAAGFHQVTWTFDPLLRRNAYFNLAKLGAMPYEYLYDFYGAMPDEVNAGDESDRVLVCWRLYDPHVAEAAAGRPYRPEVPADAEPGLIDEQGRPVVRRTTSQVVLVQLPEDIEAIRRADPGLAKAWRQALREVLAGLMDGESALVKGFARGGYVVERP
ncbi:hypothetical protein Acor_05550 [Acrocarpospora corrugata]|uniref:N-acetyltransferase domain-containing protein n=1 Tax=Acrocarpospora corrugata TaxID=35763 RepID=A0A5M3VPU5_9ACTN|nr:GNAT family N-acetyltransferase [Acrocarpospora corrugata]GER98493.1 hypothetical protein Acor_05550 [Acrocarpospora corrugata]